MLETLEYTKVQGQKADRGITVYALSTCGFCKRALAFLDANGFTYRYIHVDTIPLDIKNQVKAELRDTYKANVAFPFLTIGDSQHLVGFVEIDWKHTLGIE